MTLSGQQCERYARNLLLSEVGEKGQQTLLSSRVLIVGAGGLGSPVALYLAAAGIGTLGIVDGDCVDITNLQRQVLHDTADIGTPKVDSAKQSLAAINPDIDIETYNAMLTRENAVDIVSNYQFVIDATDNFESKQLIATACHQTRTAYSHAGILGFIGQTMTVIPRETACYRCLFRDEPPPQDGPAGVMGVVPGVIGTIQATEAVKYLLKIGNLLTDCLLVYDALKMRFRKIALRQDARCPLCGTAE